MSDTSDLARFSGSALVVEPGDMLIIGISQTLDATEAQRVTKAMSDELPGVRICLLDGVAALAVVKAAARRAADDERLSA